jgi:RNA polymerase sigma factor (sigma-70 family)
MHSGTSGPLLHHVRQVAGDPGTLTDRQLLDRFAARADPAAFAALVRRHGRLVLAACRQVLADEADVEDAFQATFLVLLRKAGAGRWHTSIGGWLFGVAHRVALKARATTYRRRRCEAVAGARRPEAVAAPDLSWREACAALHEELDRLPDKYRLPVLLCHLRGLSRDEAAAALGWSANAVKWRLERGRELLRARLTRRGITLSAGLLAVLAAPPAQAVPAGLGGATLNTVFGNPAGRPAALAALLSPGAWTTRCAALLLGALIAGAAGAGAWCLAPAGQVEAPSAAQAQTPSAPGPQAAAAPPEETVTVSGRVLGPDGKPFSGAALYTLRRQPGKPPGDRSIEAIARGTSDADGRFRFDAPKFPFGRVPRGETWPVLAVKDGYGLGWTTAPAADGELTVRLVKDQPIAGRLLDTEGRPVTKAEVRIRLLSTGQDDRLDALLQGWATNWETAGQADKLMFPPSQVVRVTAPDRDGRFRITGAGAERLVMLEVKGPAIAQAVIHVVGRAGFDPGPLNQAAAGPPGARRVPGFPPLLYGPAFDFVAVPGKVVEGRVRAAGGEPVAGAHVTTNIGWRNTFSATTDAQGRFTLAGLPKQATYNLWVTPGQDTPFVTRSVDVPDTEGLRPVRAEIELARGVVVTGRVIDRQTGKGVSGGVYYLPLPGNPFVGKPGFDLPMPAIGTGPSGQFRLPILPGPGALMAQAHGGETFDGQDLNPYLPAALSEEDRKHVNLTDDGEGYQFIIGANHSVAFLSNEQAVKWLNLAENAGTVTQDLYVHRGKTATVHVQDADGKPLAGAIVSGMTACGPTTFALKQAQCTVYALDPQKPRMLLFNHPGRNLAGRLPVRGDEPWPLTVKLLPAGSVTGRVLDADGLPVAGVEVGLSSAYVSAADLERFARHRRPPGTTGPDGRFRIDGVVPGQPFTLSLRKGPTVLVGPPRLGPYEVASGTTLDLGDLRTKPQP